jgi:hypothetical protein
MRPGMTPSEAQRQAKAVWFTFGVLVGWIAGWL